MRYTQADNDFIVLSWENNIFKHTCTHILMSTYIDHEYVIPVI